MQERDDDFDLAGVDVADFEEKGWEAEGAFGCPVQVGRWRCGV